MSDLFVAVIDDDTALRAALTDLMRAVGHRAESFESGEAFMTSPWRDGFDYVIADIDLPGMSGLDLVQIFKNRGGTAPMLLITALTDPRLPDEAISLGAHAFLRKPFEIEALLRCIEEGAPDGHHLP